MLDTAVTPANGFGILPAPGAIDQYLSAANAKKQAWFTVSGYGLSDQDPVPVSFRERLMARSYLVNNQAPVTEFNPKTTCQRLAGQGRHVQRRLGRPLFFGDTNVIAAVTSFGMNGLCKSLDFSYRLDRAPVLQWILDPYRVDAG